MKRTLVLISLAVLFLIPGYTLLGQDNDKNGEKLPSEEQKFYSAGFSLAAFSVSYPNLSDLAERVLAYTPVLDMKPDDSIYDPLRLMPGKKINWAYLQLGSVLGYHHARYWIRNGFVEDWQYQLTWSDQKKRLLGFGAWRFDSNAFQTNWTHAFAGSAYYNFARANNLSVLSSFLLTLGESMYWEYIVEWREVISINDHIFTSIGGASVGETLFQLGSYLNSRPGLLGKIMGFLNPIIKFNKWLDGSTVAGSENTSVAPGRHKFQLSAGRRDSLISGGTGRPALMAAAFQADIIKIPEYGKTGQESRPYLDPIASELDFSFATGKRGVEDFNLFMRTVLLGYYKQNVDDQAKGFGYYVGLGSAFSLFKKRAVVSYDGLGVSVGQGADLNLDEPRQFTDKYSLVHIAGPVLDFTSFSQAFTWRLVLEAYPDFGLINSLALNKYSGIYGLSGAKTTLLYYGYYYGFGTTLASTLKIDSGLFNVDASVRYQTHGSIEGRDRFQADLADDFHLRDSRLGYIFRLGYRIRGTPVALLASFEEIDRRGSIREVFQKETENRLFFGMNLIF